MPEKAIKERGKAQCMIRLEDGRIMRVAVIRKIIPARKIRGK